MVFFDNPKISLDEVIKDNKTKNYNRLFQKLTQIDNRVSKDNMKRNIINFICESFQVQCIRQDIENPDFLDRDWEEEIPKISDQIIKDLKAHNISAKESKSNQANISNFWEQFVNFVFNGKLADETEDQLEDEDEAAIANKETFEVRYELFETA